MKCHLLVYNIQLVYNFFQVYTFLIVVLVTNDKFNGILKQANKLTVFKAIMY